MNTNFISNKFIFLSLLLLIIFTLFVSAATLKGTIYNSDLDIETNVLVEINSAPIQKFLSKDGTYSFELTKGDYQLTATKGLTSIKEDVQISSEGVYIFDLFLLSDFTEEDELWTESEEDLFAEDSTTRTWAYYVTGIIIIALLIRFILMRKKYGSLRLFRKKMKIEHQKTLAEHQQEINQNPNFLNRVLEILQKHDGRIHQKDLRKEMLDLSEAKISLMITELEHKGKIEKIKKGRGNVIILKEN